MQEARFVREDHEGSVYAAKAVARPTSAGKSLLGVVGLWNLNLRAYHAVMRTKKCWSPSAAVRFLFRKLK